MLDQSVTLPPSPGSVATCDGASAQNRAMVPLSEFYLATHERERETKRQRAERIEVMRDIRALFAAERRAQRVVAIRTRVAARRARTSHRVGTAKPTTSGSSDDDGEPPGRFERCAVATVRPDGSPITVVIMIDPLRIDPKAMLFMARRAAGWDAVGAARGLDTARVDVVHPYGKAGVA